MRKERGDTVPISKNNRVYYTAEQYAAARQNNNALEYVRRQGYDLVQEGKFYRLKDHDSLVFTADGRFFWNSRGVHGGALEFLVQYEGRSFPEAVLLLAGDAVPSSDRRNCPEPPPKSQEAPPIPPVEFRLPPPAKDMRRMFGYLCGTRKLMHQVVVEMIAQGIVYESVYHTPSGKELHNACFVSFDSMGNPCNAYQRGMTSTGTPYKGDVPGGNKSFGWLLHGKEPTKLYVFEAAIDAASYVTLLLRQGEYPLDRGDYLALGGLNFTPILRYLDRHPHTDEITLLLDGDPPGQAAAKRFRAALEDLGYTVETILPPMGKDWNDTLKALCEEQK